MPVFYLDDGAICNVIYTYSNVCLIIIGSQGVDALEYNALEQISSPNVISLRYWIKGNQAFSILYYGLGVNWNNKSINSLT